MAAPKEKDIEYGKAATSDEDAEATKMVPFSELFRFSTAFDWLLTALAATAAGVAGFGQIYLIVGWGDFLDVAANPADARAENLDLFLRMFVGTGLVVGTCAWIYTSLFLLTGHRQGMYWRKYYLESVLRQDVSWFDVHNPTELPSKIAEKTAAVQAGLGLKLGEGIFFGIQLLGGFVYAFFKSWEITLVSLVTAPLVGWGLYYLTKVTGEADGIMNKAYAKAGGNASETIENIKTVNALQCEDARVKEYDAHLIEARTAGEDRAKRIGFANGLVFSTGNFMTGTTILYFAFSIAKQIRKYGLALEYGGDDDGTYEPSADAFVAMFMIQQGAQGLGNIAPMIKALSAARYAAYEILATINRKPPIDTREEGLKPSDIKGEIKFENVAFAYPSRPDPPIYKDLTVTIEAGTTVAFVGASGSGKSTAVQLIERFYDPDNHDVPDQNTSKTGRVTLDGVDLKELDINWLREQIALVGQEPVLFAGTIGENIARGKPGATKEEIEHAAKMSNAHDFIMEFPKGYDTDVGGGGSGQLSGGQKQRVAIARAMIKDPKILLLDEATSALDNNSERIVQAALDELLANHPMTTLVIAHRLTTIRNADKIVVLDRGDLIEQGSHDELMAKEGAYYKLVLAAEHVDAANARASETGSPRSGRKVPLGSTDLSSPETTALVAQGDGEIELGAMGEETDDLKQKEAAASEAPATGGILSYCGLAPKTEKQRLEAETKKKEAKEKAAKEAAAKTRVWALLDPSDKKLLYLGVFGATLTAVNNAIVGIIFTKIITVLFETNPKKLEYDGATWCGIMIASSFLSQFGEQLKAYGFGMMKAKVTQLLRRDLYRALITQDMTWYDLTPAGELTSLLGEECFMVPALTGEALGQTISFALSVIFSLGFAFSMGSAKVAGIFLAMLPFMMIGMVIEFAVITGASAPDAKASMGASAANIMSESVRSIRTVYSYGLQKNLIAEFEREFDVHLAAEKVKALGQGSSRFFSQATLFIGFGIVYFIANGWLIDDAEKTDKYIVDGEKYWSYSSMSADNECVKNCPFILPGRKNVVALGDLSPMETFLLPIFCMFMLAAGFGSAAMDATDLGKAAAAAVKLFAIIDRKPDIDRNGGGQKLDKVQGQFDFQNVAFTYPSRKELPVYTDLTVTIEAGQTVAFVGSSGSGKSTGVQLIERFYDPEKGAVLLDGVDIKTLDLNWLRSQIGLVGQEPVLFSGTIKENIALGKDNPTEEEIVEAAKAANAYDFIMEQPEGFDTQVGVGGGKLSGGQKQRVAIARAIIKDPPILLLDEATSALDNKSEEVVQAALDDLLAKKKRTTLVIAHRLTTIQSADKIVVLDHGDVIEQGTHAELMSQKGVYASLTRTMH